MATFQTYEQVGIKEDISDIISNISPTKTPFQTAIGSEKINNTLFQWQEDSLRAVAAAPAVEGADATYITVNPTVMRNNRTQIFVEAVQTSGTVDAVSLHGRARESAYQLAKSAAQLKRDLENAYVGTAQAAVVGNDSTARQMAGVQQQVDVSLVSYMGAATNLSETALLAALQAAFSAGADPTRIQVTPSNSLILANFAAAAGRYRTLQTGGNDKAIVNVVNLYVSPFGEQKVELNRFLRAKNTLIYDPEMWSKVTLRSWSRETLAKTGDSLKQMIVGEFSLKHKNYKASAIVVDNATTGF
jgi:hypothetical protein